MKSLSTILLLFSIQFCLGQNTLTWSNDIVIPTTGGNSRPRIALNREKKVIVAWGDMTAGKIYTSVQQNDSTFSAPVNIVPGSSEAYVQDWTSHEIVSFGDTIYIVFKMKPEASGGCYMVKSTDGGYSFSDTIRIDPKNNHISWLPTVTVDSLANPVVAYMDYDSGWVDPRYVLTSSFNGGLTFSSPVNATTGKSPGEVCDCCPAAVNAFGEKRFIAYRNNESNIRTIYITKSDDNGATFNQAAEVDLTNSYSTQCQATGPHTLMFGDSLITVWRGSATNIKRVHISSTSIDSLETGTYKMVSPSSNTSILQNYPRISAEDTTIALVWQETLSGNTEIILSWSNTGINGLTGRDTVNSYSIGHQINPDILIRDGQLYFTWQDNARKYLMFKKAELSSITGVSETSNNMQISIFPNPAKGVIKVSSPFSAGTYKVFDLLGKEIQHGFFEKREFSFTLSEHGYLLLKLIDEKQNSVSRLLLNTDKY